MAGLPGIGCILVSPEAGGGGGAATCAFLSNNGSNANATTYTFSGQGLGAAAASRLIHVTASGGASGSAARSLGSAEIAGVAANIDVNDETDNRRCQAIATAAVPTGTSGDIELVFNDTIVNCEIGIYRGVDLTTGLIDADADETVGAGPTGVSLSVLDGGYVVACGISYRSGAAAGLALTGVTKDYETQRETDWAHAGGHIAVEADGTANLVGTGTSQTSGGLCGVSYR